MKADDFDAVVGIDEKVLKAARPEYYEMKFEKLFETVAEKDDGRVVGFIMGETYMGEFGIFQDEASLDTIGVDPDYQHQGIGEQLMNEFMDHMRKLGVRKINTIYGSYEKTRRSKNKHPGRLG
jgi:ribosomal protein S18 acetylase RimI-like enzyme